MMMIHDPAALVVGTSTDMRKTAETLDKIKGGLVSAYMTHTKESKAKVEQMMTDRNMAYSSRGGGTRLCNRSSGRR
jgi:ATP-dependent protease ClpP protease subunit